MQKDAETMECTSFMGIFAANVLPTNMARTSARSLPGQTGGRLVKGLAKSESGFCVGTLTIADVARHIFFEPIRGACATEQMH